MSEKKRNALRDLWVVTKGSARLIAGRSPILLVFILVNLVLLSLLPLGRNMQLGKAVEAVGTPEIWSAIASVLLYFALSELFQRTQNFLSKLGDGVFTEIFGSLFQRVRIAFGPSSFLRSHPQNRELAAAQRDEYWAKMFFGKQTQLVGQLLTIIVGSVVLVRQHPLLAIALATASAVALFVQGRAAIANVTLERGQDPIQAETTWVKTQLNDQSTAAALFALGADGALADRIDQNLGRMYRERRLLLFRKLPGEAVVPFVIASAMFGALVLAFPGGVQLSRGPLTFIIVTLFTISVSLSRFVEMLAEQWVMSEKIASLFGAIRIVAPSKDDTGRELPKQGTGEISTRDLTFGYGGKKMVYDRFSVDFAGGETTFFFGANGVGKSTLVSLINGHYEAPPRSVFIDGVPVEEISKASLRQSVRLLSQGTVNFRLTMRENLALIGPADESYDRLIWQALRMARLDEKVKGFEHGLDEPLAVWNRARESFSGGEMRKANLAILIYGVLLGQVRTIILDEPFGPIDPPSAREILAELRNLRVTLILSAHTTDFIRSNDRVVFLDRIQDRVVAFQGTHLELLDESEGYRNFVGTRRADELEVLLRHARATSFVS